MNIARNALIFSLFKFFIFYILYFDPFIYVLWYFKLSQI